MSGEPKCVLCGYPALPEMGYLTLPSGGVVHIQCAFHFREKMPTGVKKVE
jgi:hypothetical protein